MPESAPHRGSRCARIWVETWQSGKWEKKKNEKLIQRIWELTDMNKPANVGILSARLLVSFQVLGAIFPFLPRVTTNSLTLLTILAQDWDPETLLKGSFPSCYRWYCHRTFHLMERLTTHFKKRSSLHPARVWLMVSTRYTWIKYFAPNIYRNDTQRSQAWQVKAGNWI